MNELLYSYAESKIKKVLNSIFIIYDELNYASCFYIGRGLFITNKHFFNNPEVADSNEVFYVKNKNFKFVCKKIFVPKNNVDLAVVGIKDEAQSNGLVPIKIYEKKVCLLDVIYCANFSYFDKNDTINKITYPNFTKGVVSKIVKYNNVDFLYQIDAACYSGGSGGPILNMNNELVGVLFQNLSFDTADNFVQLANSGFILSKEIIHRITKQIDSNKKLEDMWIFNIKDDELDCYFNFKSFSPKF